MDPLAQLNSQTAAILGWKHTGLIFQRDDGKGFIEVLSHIPNYCENLIAMWRLIEHAAMKRVEYSLFMMHYDAKHPIYMASFIKGLEQRTSTGADPKICTVKAFLMMFTPEPPLTRQ